MHVVFTWYGHPRGSYRGMIVARSVDMVRHPRGNYREYPNAVSSSDHTGKTNRFTGRGHAYARMLASKTGS